MQVVGERRPGSLWIATLDGIDEPLVLLQDLEQVTWIAPRLHVHQADESTQLVQELRNQLES